VTCVDVQLSCCHTSLFVTYALRGVTSQQQAAPAEGSTRINILRSSVLTYHTCCFNLYNLYDTLLDDIIILPLQISSWQLACYNKCMKSFFLLS